MYMYMYIYIYIYLCVRIYISFYFIDFLIHLTHYVVFTYCMHVVLLNALEKIVVLHAFLLGFCDSPLIFRRTFKSMPFVVNTSFCLFYEHAKKRTRRAARRKRQQKHKNNQIKKWSKQASNTKVLDDHLTI